MKILLFGTGDYYNRFKKWFSNYEIIALIDNSLEKQGSYIDGHIVLSPEIAIKMEFDYIIILSFYVKSMKDQLFKLGVDDKKIYHFFQLHDLLNGQYERRKLVKYEVKNKNEELINEQNDKERKRVVLFSNDLMFGGPALALLNVALYLNNKGHDVTFVSMLDGPLAKQLVELGIEVVIDENLQLQTMDESVWKADCDLMICNTINFYVFLSEKNNTIPIIWWLHDSNFFYDGVDKERLKNIDFSNVKVLSVGPVPKMAIREFIPDLIIDDLLYGSKEYYLQSDNLSKYKSSNIIRFVTAGYIESRKGQDILIDAIKVLDKATIEKCEFIFVGQNESLFARKLINLTRDINQIKYVGVVGREDMHELMKSADALICPSREDPMPTVCAEAMMHSTACIVSNCTGTAYYIDNMKNGLIFESEDANDLARKIKWSVDNIEELRKMGISSRKVYDRVFSVNVFEENLNKILEFGL